jgi:Protein of unknown function (DUF1569)
MKSAFEKNNFEELQDRLKKLTAGTAHLWGKMNVAQMLHHLNLTMEAPLGKAQTKGKPIFFMKMFRSVLYNDRPFGKGAPTPKEFKITDNYDFDREKEKCVSNLNEIYTRNVNGNYLPHVFFGRLTNEQWGKHFYKHVDHHLRQFGA